MIVNIGNLPLRLRVGGDDLLQFVRERYSGFMSPGAQTDLELAAQVSPARPSQDCLSVSLEVSLANGRWSIRRGDFRATWDPQCGRGEISQFQNPYAVDTVLRIVHTLLLAEEGGFLLHAASAVRGDRAFLLSGISGSGKSTICRLAPTDTSLLTDEISFVRRWNGQYRAFGTPYTGELDRAGENISAPVAALYFLSKGESNRIDDLRRTEAARLLLRNILFFAKDPRLAKRLFEAVCQFTDAIPTYRLTFVPDPSVWELIR
jgi:hypothetical protein